MKPRSKIAVLDVDGTLVAGALGIELLQQLVRASACDPDAAHQVLEILDQHRRGTLDFPTMAVGAYEAYARALAGRRCSQVEAIARELWARRRSGLFGFVPELVAYLKAQGYRILIISGSPAEMVSLVADELGIRECYGATFARRGDVYSGHIERSSGVPGEKGRILAEATRHDDVCWSRCFVLGDSLTDVVLFEQVGLPLVFEPGAELSRLAHERGWPIAQAADVVARTQALVSSEVVARGASASAGTGTGTGTETEGTARC